MQLARTNAVFSRIAMVSCFCAEINFQEKYQKIYQKLYFPRRLTEPEGEERKAPEWAIQDPGSGPGLAAPFAYMTYVMRNFEGVRSFSRNKSAAPPPLESLF